jgi:ABC-type nitrate/sulfonate/bicarbonate transport system substrate-binding protein
MKRQIVFALIPLCCLCGYRNGAAQEKIRIGISAISLGFLPTIVAEKKAFYAKHRIQSEHVLVPCAIATNALLSDDLDYAVCTGPGIAGAIKGLPIKLVMTTQDKLGYLLLVKANVQKLADLRGKTIGISTFGSQLYLTTITLLRRYGMEPGKDVNLIPGGDNNARIAAKWLKLDLATTRAAFENYLPCYSADGSLPDQALQDLIQYELDRGNLKKEIPLTQVASRALLQQAQKELNLR